MPHKDTLMDWLRDAHAMEQALVTTLEAAGKDAARNGRPLVEAKLKAHAEATREHADLIRRCLERHGESTSAMKTTMGKISNMFSELGKATAEDKVVKDALQGYAAEHFEIACYTALITAARRQGDEETASTCERILQDEVEMAEWYKANLPTVVGDYLATHEGAVG